MSDDPTQEADRRLEAALADAGARDPREFYRERLRELKQARPNAYDEAVRYYKETLIPSVASGDDEPLSAWTEYGCRLAELTASGRPTLIDPTGRARAYASPPPPDHLILHLPDEKGARALVVGLPAELTPAQRATYDVLVAGKQRLPKADR